MVLSAESYSTQIVPGVAVVLAVLSLNVLGEAAREALDPRALDQARGEGR